MTTRFYEYIRDGVPSGASFRYQILDSGLSVIATEIPDLGPTSSQGWIADTTADEFGSDQYFPSVRFFNDVMGGPTWNVRSLKVDVDPAGGTSWGELARFPISVDLAAGDELRVNGAALTFASYNAGIPVIIDEGGTSETLSYRHSLRSGTTDLPDSTETGANFHMSVGAGELRLSPQGASVLIENDTGSEWTGANIVMSEVQDSSGDWHFVDRSSFTSIDVPNGATLEFTEITLTFSYS